VAGIAREEAIHEWHFLKRSVVFIEDFHEASIDDFHAGSSNVNLGLGHNGMPDGVCPAECGARECFPVGITPRTGGELLCREIGHICNKIKTTNEMSFAGKSDNC
jgi:hypothetical protein